VYFGSFYQIFAELERHSNSIPKISPK